MFALPVWQLLDALLEWTWWWWVFPANMNCVFPGSLKSGEENWFWGDKWSAVDVFCPPMGGHGSVLITDVSLQSSNGLGMVFGNMGSDPNRRQRVPSFFFGSQMSVHKLQCSWVTFTLSDAHIHAKLSLFNRGHTDLEAAGTRFKTKKHIKVSSHRNPWLWVPSSYKSVFWVGYQRGTRCPSC